MYWLINFLHLLTSPRAFIVGFCAYAISTKIPCAGFFTVMPRHTLNDDRMLTLMSIGKLLFKIVINRPFYYNCHRALSY